MARAYHAVTERQLGPFCRNQIAADRARIAEMNALAEGHPVPPPTPAIVRLFTAASEDADVFRGVIEIALGVSQPQDVITRPHIAAKLAELDDRPLPPNAKIIDRDRMASLPAG